MKVQDGLSKAFDFANSSLFDASKDGVTGKTALGLAVLNGAKASTALFDGLFSADSHSLAGKSSIDAQSQDAQGKFNLAGTSLFSADSSGATAQSDLGMVIQNSQKLAALKLSDLLQVGRDTLSFSGDHTVQVQQAEGGSYHPVFNTALALESVLPLHHEAALA